jgi:hypothetical protein
VSFHPDGKQVSCAGFDGVVRIFEADTGKLIKQFSPVPLTTEVAAAPAQ